MVYADISVYKIFRNYIELWCGARAYKGSTRGPQGAYKRVYKGLRGLLHDIVVTRAYMLLLSMFPPIDQNMAWRRCKSRCFYPRNLVLRMANFVLWF